MPSYIIKHDYKIIFAIMYVKKAEKEMRNFTKVGEASIFKETSEADIKDVLDKYNRYLATFYQ